MMSVTPQNPALPPKVLSPRRMRLVLFALTALTLLIHGYHPLAEDGGLYAAGVEYLLNPALFPHYTAFVTEHLRFSLFAPTLAAIVHLTHLPSAWALLLTNLLSLWLTFYAARKLLQRCTSTDSAQLAGLCLLTVFWTLPIAGTSLYLMDPYLTGRSLSTPLTLLAIAFALDPWRTNAPLPNPTNARSPNPINVRVAHPSQSHRHGWGTRLPASSAQFCLLTLILAALFHPLMAAYALALVLILRITRLRRRTVVCFILLIAALALAAILQSFAPPESAALIAAERSRYYWFLSQWHSYEILGLAGPLIILTLLLRRYRSRTPPPDHNAATLCCAALVAGAIAITICLFFAHEDAPTHLVARLQPLRIFLPIYAIMTLLLGATLYQQLLAAKYSRLVRRTLPALTLLTLAATMFTFQRLTFPASFHLELPWRATLSPNPWVQAFLWARANTPPDALFALDAQYVNEPGEDAQTFRAIALRSALPDFSKDGGEAAITPQLAPLWQPSAAAQTNLSTETDTLRDTRLAPFAPTWMILHSTAPTAHPCPYNNGTIKVCQLHPMYPQKVQ
jgi:hypothetical protein